MTQIVALPWTQIVNRPDKTTSADVLAGTDDSKYVTSLPLKTNYYNKTEIDAALAVVSPVGHTHDDRYFTEGEILAILLDFVEYEFDDSQNFVGATRGCGIYNDGTIRWGNSQVSNARGILSWDGDGVKAIIGSPNKLSVESPYVDVISVLTVHSGAVVFVPDDGTTLTTNGQLVVERVSNTLIRIKLRGDDGVDRSVLLTLG